MLKSVVKTFFEHLSERKYFVSTFSQLERETVARSKESPQRNKIFLQVLAGVLILLTISFVYFHIQKYLQWPPKVYSDPEIVNLTKKKVVWDVFIGGSEKCGKIDCFLTSDFDSKNYVRQAVLPIREFPLSGFTPGKNIYYRTKIVVPPEMLNQSDTIMFHSLYIHAKRYEFYVNERLLDVGGKQLLNIPIPRDFINADGVAWLAFKVDSGELPYQGISHFGDVVIGPKSKLIEIEYFARDIKTTYHLWYILPRITIGLVFLFIFLTVTRSGENLLFSAYALSSSMFLYFESDLPLEISSVFLPSLAEHRSLLAITTPLLFIPLMHRYFRRKNKNLKYFYWFIACSSCASFFIFTLMFGESVAFELSGRVGRVLRLSGSIYAVYLAAITSLYLFKSRKSRFRLPSSIILLLFTSLSTILYAAYWLRVLPVIYGDFILLAHDTIFMTILAGLMAMEFGQTMHQRDHIKKNLRKFVDTQVADKVIDDHDILKPRKNNVTVMFCDIRSFTNICEMLSPEEVVEMLNGYLETMVQVIQAHGGVVDKFGGDSILAVWGVPSEQENHAMNAAICAVAMRKELRLFNRHRQSVGKIPISIGVALHSGPVIAGAIGSESRLDYTVIGDTVNTAARLESLTKEFGADTLISQSTWDLIKENAMASRVKEVKVKGKSKATMVYKLIGTFDLALGFHCYDDTYQATIKPPYRPGIVENIDTNLVIYKYG